MRLLNWRSTPPRWTNLLIGSVVLLASACATFSDANSPDAFCAVAETIGWQEGDTEETIERIVEHDRRVICLCPDNYPDKKVEALQCPKR